jgi:hypothetical protein
MQTTRRGFTLGEFVVCAIILIVLCIGLYFLASFIRNVASTQPNKDHDNQHLRDQLLRPDRGGAANSEDEELARMLVGTWEQTRESGKVTVSAVETFFPDGTTTLAGTITIDGKKSAISSTGTWRVERKKIHEKVIHSSMLPEGKTWSDEIVKLTDTELVTRASDGEIETRRRISK